MNEEYVSGGLYRSAFEDPATDVLSWQGVDGKGYFAADIKLRMPDKRRCEPDLVLQIGAQLWLVEVKGTHTEALPDEAKLAELVGVLGQAEVLRQVEVRSGYAVRNCQLVVAVAYYHDDLVYDIEAEGTTESSCVPTVLHIDWSVAEPAVAEFGLASVLDELYGAPQSST